MKKIYQKPEMMVVALQHKGSMLSGSRSAKSVNSSEGFNWKTEGFDATEEDM